MDRIMNCFSKKTMFPKIFLTRAWKRVKAWARALHNAAVTGFSRGGSYMAGAKLDPAVFQQPCIQNLDAFLGNLFGFLGYIYSEGNLPDKGLETVKACARA